MSYSPKSKALALIPKFTGLLSFLGSTLIFQDIVRDRKKRSRVYHRLVLGLSSFDIMASVVNVLSTWPIPAGTPGVYLASGTTGTCAAQGFFNETGNVCTPLYNASLCLYYILIIREGWSEKRLRRIEPFLHALPLTVGWTMGVLGLPLDLYNNSGWLCWIAPYPPNCHVDPNVPCTRGGHASLFRWIHYGLIWSAIVFVTVGMSVIYRTVRQKEKASARYTHAHLRASVHQGLGVGGGGGGGGSGSATTNGARVSPKRGRRRASFFNALSSSAPAPPLTAEEAAAREAARAATRQAESSGGSGHSRKVALQAMLFVSALYLTWIFTTLTRIFQIVQGKTYFPLLVLMATFFPLQGFFNAMIYLRPRLVRARQRHPDQSWFRVFLTVVRARGKDGEDTDFSASTRSRLSTLGRVTRRLSSLVPRRSSVGRRSSGGGSSRGSFGNVGGGDGIDGDGGEGGGGGGGRGDKSDNGDNGEDGWKVSKRFDDDNDNASAVPAGPGTPPGLVASNSEGGNTEKCSLAGAANGESPGRPRGSVQWAATLVARELAADVEVSSDDEEEEADDDDERRDGEEGGGGIATAAAAAPSPKEEAGADDDDAGGTPSSENGGGGLRGE